MHLLPEFITILEKALSWHGVHIYATLEQVDASLLVIMLPLYPGQPQPTWRSEAAQGALVIYTLRDYFFRDDLRSLLPGCIGQVYLRRIDAKKCSLQAAPAKMPDEVETLGHLARQRGYKGELSSDYSLAEKERKRISSETLVRFGWGPVYERQLERTILLERQILWEKKTSKLEKLVEELVLQLGYDGFLHPQHAAQERAASMTAETGRPGLGEEEIIRRLAYALWAEAMRAEHPKMPWKQISYQIQWPYSVKLLENARQRLQQTTQDGDEARLEAARQFLAGLEQPR